MATLKDAIAYASKNPNSDFAKQLTVFVQSGKADEEAKASGINLTPIKRFKVPEATTPETAPVAEEPKTGGILSTIADVGKGALKGLGQTMQNIGNIVAKPVGKLFGIEEEKIGLPEQTFEAQNTAQTIGKGAERIAEFLVPAGKVASISNNVNKVIGASNIIAKPLARVLATGSIEALFSGALTTAQTGDIEQGEKAALIGGALGGGLKAVGETARALNIPEKLYSRIFKNNFNSVKSELKTDVINGIKSSDPTRYAELLKSGVVKEVAGSPMVNETLAKQALDRGLKGSLKNMATSVIDDTLGLEVKAQNAVKGKSIMFKANEGTKNLSALFKDISEDYKNVGDGTIYKKAKEFASLVAKGKIEGGKTLEMRRFLDGMRNKASYMPSPKLSLSQSNLKFWSDKIRGKLANINGLGDVMKDYKFNIEALDSLAKESARRDNKEVLGLIDSIFFGAGISGGDPVTGATITGLRKAFASPTGLTRTGQALQKGTSSGLGVATRGEISKQFAD